MTNLQKVAGELKTEKPKPNEGFVHAHNGIMKINEEEKNKPS